MNWYKIAKEKIFPSFSSPESLLEWMDKIEYGWMDSDYKEKLDGDWDENDFWDDYSMLLPHEVVEHKVGVCWDQTVFENHIFNTQFDFPHKMIFIQQYKIGTHTFLVYEKKDQWYWFEHSFNKYRGIHGPYDSIEDIVVDVFEKMEEYEGGSSGYEWAIMDPDDFKTKLTCKEFMDACDYNYDEMEETDRESEKKKHKDYNKLDTQLFEGYKGPFKR